VKTPRFTARHWLGAVVLLCIGACTTTPVARPPAPSKQPFDPLAIADAVPKVEPRAASGNPPFYQVMGQRYFVLPSADGFVERGVASWYGPGFHESRTATGEPYDMYAMSAAHRTLPLPAYVQVTNLRNGRSVIVRVNDRGPFRAGRVIDLSYTAAAKLDMLREGTAFVEIHAITPGEKAVPAHAAQPNQLFVQAGAFSAEPNASRLVTKLRGLGYAQAFVRADDVNGRKFFRVRVGPVPTVDEFDRVVAHLKSFGVNDARLAVD
jgi:rare lipoprotein A